MVGEEERVERSGGGELKKKDGIKREWGEEKEEEKEGMWEWGGGEEVEGRRSRTSDVPFGACPSHRDRK